MPCRSESASLPVAMSYSSLRPISEAIADGEEQSIRILPSQSRVMNRQVGSTSGLTTVRSRPMPVGDLAPVGDARAAERVGADPHAGLADPVDVEDVGRSSTYVPRKSYDAAAARARVNGTRRTSASPPVISSLARFGDHARSRRSRPGRRAAGCT